MTGERWVTTLGYELVYLNQNYYVMRRGRLYVKEHIPDNEISLRVVGTAVNYDEAIEILRGLRARLETEKP